MNRSGHTVGDAMSEPVVTISRATPAEVIGDTLRQWGVGALPVVDDRGQVVGVVTAADLPVEPATPAGQRPAGPRRDRSPDERRTAQGLMTTPAVTVSRTASLAHAARTMAGHQVGRLPVVDAAGRLRGIVSRSDLLRLSLCRHGELDHRVRADVVAPLFAGGGPGGGEPATVPLAGALPPARAVPLADSPPRTVDGVVDARTDRLPPGGRVGDPSFVRDDGHRTVGMVEGSVRDRADP